LPADTGWRNLDNCDFGSPERRRYDAAIVLMDLKTSNVVSSDLVRFLKFCYRFLNEYWPHANREPIPDQGFEEAFRSECVSKLRDWRISQIREMHLGEDLFTASGTDHEIDLVGLLPWFSLKWKEGALR
jgi:hypothetical protein